MTIGGKCTVRSAIEASEQRGAGSERGSTKRGILAAKSAVQRHAAGKMVFASMILEPAPPRQPSFFPPVIPKHSTAW